MDDAFKIIINNLVEGKQEKIDKNHSPAFLEINEADLSFTAPVRVKGRAELIEGMFILHLSVNAEALIPCVICNHEVRVNIEIPNFCYTIEQNKIQAGIFDYRDILREEILLMIPKKAECALEGCPERAALAGYFSKDKCIHSGFEDL